MRLWISCLCVLVVSMIGCGSQSKDELKIVPARGVLTLDGMPLAEADVAAFPLGETPGLGGGCRSNERGEFQFTHARGEIGLPPGSYKLTVSLRKRPDGSVPPVNDPTPPIESSARETLAPHFSDPAKSILTQIITDDGKPFDLKLDSKAKPAKTNP